MELETTQSNPITRRNKIIWLYSLGAHLTAPLNGVFSALEWVFMGSLDT